MATSSLEESPSHFPSSSHSDSCMLPSLVQSVWKQQNRVSFLTRSISALNSVCGRNGWGDNFSQKDQKEFTFGSLAHNFCEYS
jgi:hypothetical protein